MSNKLIYRPEIDGLRAIAVTAVILYHARISILGYQPFKGGFIGVDIFFVISGYLITSIIFNELITTGSFSFKKFYERRIRRILPVLLVVMLTSLPFAWMYIQPDSYVDFSKSIIYSLGFSSNFYFHHSGQEYGDVSGIYIPFLHTWSLSVEEQYYVIFPIIFLILFIYFRRYLIHFLIFGFVFSLVLAGWGSRNYPSATFYLLFTRIWEILAGSILAYYEISLKRRCVQKKFNLIFPSVGLLLIVHSIIFFNKETYHPSFYTLSPIIGVGLIIWFSNSNELITKILSTKLLVFVGLISYSLYLWHYPIFSFAKLIDFVQGDLSKKLLLGIIILFLSILSYYFCEKPARSNNFKFKNVLTFIIFVYAFLITFSLNVITSDGHKSRLPEILQGSVSQAPWDLLKNSDNENCHHNSKGCQFNIISNQKVYLIGDSHAASIMFDLKQQVVKKNYQFNTFTFGGCGYFPGFDQILIKTQKISDKCNNDYFLKLKENLLKEKNQIFIFMLRFPVYLTGYGFDNKEGGIEGGGIKPIKWSTGYISNGKYESLQNSFKNEILELSKNNKIILVYPFPEAGWHPNRKIFIERKNKFSNNYALVNTSTDYKIYKSRNKSSFELLDSIRHNNIHRVYPHTIVCNTYLKNRCITHDGKHNYYADDDHPSIIGSKFINKIIMREVDKIFSYN